MTLSSPRLLALPALTLAALVSACGDSTAVGGGGAGGTGGEGGAGGAGGAALGPFTSPEPVTIDGWTEDAMEPFLSRDGAILFFNNSNAPTVDTNLHWAERVDDTTFTYRGEIGGANSPLLDAVASMDDAGAFYFVSLRSYEATLHTVHTGQFADGAVSGVTLIPGIATEVPGEVNFDADISADGATLYLVDGRFEVGSPVPVAADIVVVNRTESGFVRGDTALTAAINTAALEYAPTTSADELELFFTRAEGTALSIWVARRGSTSEPFGAPEKIEAIEGQVEGPTISPDGRSLYFHKHDGARFVIQRVTR